MVNFSLEAARKVLADPNADQLSRDLAQIFLAEEDLNNDDNSIQGIACGKMMDTKQMFADMCPEWIQIESYARGLLALTNEEAVQLALEALLVKEHDKLSAKMTPSGQYSIMLAYAKLVDACEALIRYKPKQDPFAIAAHIVLAMLGRAEDASSAIAHYQKAISARPRDWRIRSKLASTYMIVDKLSLCLQELTVAEELAPSAKVRFDLATRKAKVLFNIGQHDEAQKAFLKVLQDSENFQNELTDKDVGHLAVSQYILCQLYALKRDKANARLHWTQAEEKRKSIPESVQKNIDLQARSLTQMVLGGLDSSLLSHQECCHCRKLKEDPKQCSRCHVAVYCSKECQVAAWKVGHKHECAQLLANKQSQKQKQALEKKQAILTVEPLDATLDPHKLWAKAVKLSKQKDQALEAVFYFLVALFMDFSLDANDKKPAHQAVAACGKDGHPMVLALKIAMHMGPQNPLERCNEVQERLPALIREWEAQKGLTRSSEESLDKIDRFQFGIAMCYIFHARILGRCFSVRSVQQATNRTHHEAFEDIVQLISEAKAYMEPRRWLTFQFELGYSNFDVCAVQVAKVWLGMFLQELDLLKKTHGKLTHHWKSMRSRAQQKMDMLPMLEMAHKSGFMGGSM